MKFGLALSGGGIRGAAHVGAIKALTENGLYPSWISGTSAGSIVAALYACGNGSPETEAAVQSLNSNVLDTDYPGIAINTLRWIFTKKVKWDGIIRGNSLEKMMKKLTGGKQMREASTPLAITSVDINTGVTVIFVSNKRGLTDTKDTIYRDDVPIYEAVRASIAVPVVFKPKIIHGMRLVDGGVTDNVPVDVLKRMGAQKVIGINLGYSGQRKDEVDNILEIGSQAIDIMSYHITSLKTKEADYIINPHIYDVGAIEVHRIPEMIQRGYEAVSSNLNTIKKVINS